MQVAAYSTVAVFFLGLVPPLTAAEVEFGPVQVHEGMCEPSAAVGFPEGAVDQVFIIANDQDNTLRAYGANGGAPLRLANGNLNKFLNLFPERDEDERADFEAAAWLKGKAYWIGSHSRSGKGRLREQRWQFLGATISNQSGGPAITPTGAKAFHGLLAAIGALDPRLHEKIKLGSRRTRRWHQTAAVSILRGLRPALTAPPCSSGCEVPSWTAKPS